MESRKKKKTLRYLLIFIGVIIVVRLVLPYVVLHFVNKSLGSMKGYYGHVEDIDLAIFRGAYKIDSIYINKQDSVSQKQTPFFAASLIDLSVEWRAIFKGALVGELVFENPMIVFTKDKVEPTDVAKDSSDFKKVLDDLMPLQVNRCEIKDGVVKYKDEKSKPAVDIQMDQVYVLAQNLRNSYDSSSVLPASVHARAAIYEGTLRFDAKLNPLADSPTFDMSAELQNTNLVKLNEFFQAYAKVDVNKGTFGMYTEVAAKDKKFTGYVKPIIKELDVLGHEDRNDNFFRKVWEGFVGGVGEIFQNQPKDQLATKIPFKGNLDNPTTNVWQAIANILQNAFIQAIQPSIDNEITIGSVAKESQEKKTFLQKIFSSDKKEKKDKK
jgi:hypothetical protein